MNRVARATKAAFGTQTGLCRHSNRSLFASRNRAGKRFAEARDWGGILGDSGRFQVTETARSRVSAGKAAESQRPLRRRQEPELRRSAWWARQDSNLQPSGYERVGFTGKPAKNRHFRPRLGPLVRVWLRRSIGYLLVEVFRPVGIFSLLASAEWVAPKRPTPRPGRR